MPNAAGDDKDSGSGVQAGHEAGAAERALRQMMGGTLVSHHEEVQEFVLVKPDWMEGNTKLFTEEQKKVGGGGGCKIGDGKIGQDFQPSAADGC